MYTLMIVDDEELICEGLKSKIIRMNHPDIKEIAIAHSGAQAMQLAESLRPDIVITDIRMQEIDGIELIRLLSVEQPNIKFIVISGFGDYEYVREAFKYGVVDYLLKPVGMNDLENQLRAVIDKMTQVQESNRAQYIDHQKNRQNQAAAKLAQLFGLVATNTDLAPGIYEEIELYFEHELFCIGILSFHSEKYQGNESDYVYNFLRNQKELLHLAATNAGLGRIAIVFNVTLAEDYLIIKHLLKELLCHLDENNQLEASAAISPIGNTVSSIVNLFLQAQHALSYKLVSERLKVIEYKALPDPAVKLTIPSNEIEAVMTYIQLLEIDKVKAFVDRWFQRNQLEKISIKYVQRLFDMIITAAKQHFSSQHLYQDTIPLQSFEFFHTLNDMRDYLTAYLYQVRRLVQKNEIPADTVVDIAIRYLKENYQRNINLQDVANRVSMNYSYFSTLFKEQTTMTFSSYLTKLRMEQAKYLLKDPTLRINEVCDKVGYDNLYHFSRAFKNYLGISPKDYRKGILVKQ